MASHALPLGARARLFTTTQLRAIRSTASKPFRSAADVLPAPHPDLRWLWPASIWSGLLALTVFACCTATGAAQLAFLVAAVAMGAANLLMYAFCVHAPLR